MDEPFAAIPLSWLRQKNEYFDFLLWIIPGIAHEDGNGLLKGEVQFSLRQVMLELKLTHYKALNVIAKATEDGLILPKKSSRPIKNRGEIYTANGDLLKTRTWDRTRYEQGTNKLRTSKRKKTGDLEDFSNKDRTRYEQALERSRVLPSTSTYPSDKGEAKKESLKEILVWDGMDYSQTFWEVFKLWPPDKRLNTLTLAKQYRGAVSGGTEPKTIWEAVKALCGARDPRYLPDASKWMAEEGWRAYEVRGA